MSEEFESIVAERSDGVRIDVYLANLTQCSRSQLQYLIDRGCVTVNDACVKKNHRLSYGETVKVFWPEPEKISADPEQIPLDIVYEDGDIIVINKPQGMVVHPAPGSPNGTLVNALLYHCIDLSGINEKIRPGIVHRLDKDTSGLLVAAKNDLAFERLAAAIKSRKMKRKYAVLVHGVPKNNTERISAPIGRSPRDRKKMAVIRTGRPAVTHYKVLENLGAYALVEAVLETGRTHQIRVHLAYINHPVVGDQKYGRRKNNLGLDKQALHAQVLEFNHPRTGEQMQFSADIPKEFSKVLKELREKGDAG